MKIKPGEVKEIKDARIIRHSAKGATLWRIRYSNESVDVWLPPGDTIDAPLVGSHSHYMVVCRDEEKEKEVSDYIRRAIEQEKQNKAETRKFR